MSSGDSEDEKPCQNFLALDATYIDSQRVNAAVCDAKANAVQQIPKFL